MTATADTILPRERLQRLSFAVALLALAGLAGLSLQAGGWPNLFGALLGAFAGAVLYSTKFGFASAGRNILQERRSLGLRAQTVMLGLTVMVTYPLLANAGTLPFPVSGWVQPIGLALATGAFLFGAGMQCAGGCGSGTLYVAGGGSPRMLIALAAFIAGSLIAVVTAPVWMAWPSAPAVSLVDDLGAGPALVLTLLVLIVLHLLCRVSEWRRYGKIVPLTGGALPATRGLARGAVLLAAMNILTLVATGQPWGITSAFALWGSKLAMSAGADVAAWPYWSGDPALGASVFADRTSVMDFGLLLGSLAAAASRGEFRPMVPLSARAVASAVVGGLLMGFGARLATGCNIGAFVSGVASGSLHGWVWMLIAAPASWIGLGLRSWIEQAGQKS